MTSVVKTRFIASAANRIPELESGLIETKVYSNPFVNEKDPHFNESRIKIRYELPNQGKDKFVLFRGLIEFSRPRDFSFVFNRHDNSFVANVARNKVADLKEFLSNVQVQLTEELTFRKKLKAAIIFEKQYRLQCEELYKGHALAFEN